MEEKKFPKRSADVLTARTQIYVSNLIVRSSFFTELAWFCFQRNVRLSLISCSREKCYVCI